MCIKGQMVALCCLASFRTALSRRGVRTHCTWQERMLVQGDSHVRMHNVHFSSPKIYMSKPTPCKQKHLIKRAVRHTSGALGLEARTGLFHSQPGGRRN